MRLDDIDTSDVNVDDQGNTGGSGFPMGGGGGLPIGGRMGCGSLVLVLIAALVFGVNPGDMLGGGQQAPAPHAQTQGVAGQGCDGSALKKQSCQVLALGNQTWSKVFTDGSYRAPGIVFYDRNGQSGCGAAQSAMGPFYCPADEKIYIDTSFYDELGQRFGAKGDFAQDYVIAHELGHHIQKLTGIADKVQNGQARAGKVQGNQMQVRMELQADCYAGVWAAKNRDRIEPGDVEEGLTAANAIGDDTLQRQSQGVVVQESFTHGSSQQRMQALRLGMQGDENKCDVFFQ
ncbi:MAG: hypothetical protein RIS52_1392 [Pseudomonadota bacterium]|jgi:uncharacterized protein